MWSPHCMWDARRLKSTKYIVEWDPLALLVLGLPWLQSMNPIMDWLNLTLAFRSGLKSSLPPMMVAMSCVTSALHHEDIILFLFLLLFLYHFIDLWAEPMMVVTYIVSVYY